MDWSEKIAVAHDVIDQALNTEVGKPRVSLDSLIAACTVLIVEAIDGVASEVGSQ